MPYEISAHKHRFAAWTAGRAASVKGSRFKVKLIQSLLGEIGFDKLKVPSDLPSPTAIDETHKKWREKLIQAANKRGLTLSHGVAAKVINMYLKTVFVCGGHAGSAVVDKLHPPIDSVLLDALYYEEKDAERKNVWKAARKIRWSLLNSDQYETVVDAIRDRQGSNALWKIEEYWRGHQK
jgi:hypothetical protein